MPQVPADPAERAVDDLVGERWRQGHVVLRIYDVSGRLVRSLVSGTVQEAGRHSVEWDGRDAAEAATRAGLYFGRLEAGGESDVRRLVLTR